VFVVLGGGAGIGRQSSHALAQAGATVVVVDTDPAAAAAVAAKVGGIALTADVTRRSSVEGVFADAARQAGPVRGVVDIVGVASLGPLAALDDAGWDRQFDLVLRHAYLTLQIGGRGIAQAGCSATASTGPAGRPGSPEVPGATAMTAGANRASRCTLAQISSVRSAGSAGVPGRSKGMPRIE
jgi:NAD(P)-dependent dehydrogenase (short-subunit alcohol dehydrogenase family)